MRRALDGSSAFARRRDVHTPDFSFGGAMPFRDQHMQAMLEYPCRATPGQFSAIMQEWGTRLSRDREPLIVEILPPAQSPRPDAPHTVLLFLIGRASFFEVEAIVAPGGSSLVVWSYRNQWGEVAKLWQLVLAELVRRKWCDPESGAAGGEPEGSLSGFAKKPTRVHHRYLETARYYVAVRYDVEQTKRWYSKHYPVFKGSRATFERMLTYLKAYDTWLNENPPKA